MKNNMFDFSLVQQGVDQLYESMSETSAQLADRVSSAAGTPAQRARRIVNESTRWSAASGFVTGLGGFVTLPVTLPADFLATSALQIRMIRAIAKVAGHDDHDPRIKAMILALVIGDLIGQGVKQAGGKAATQFATRFAVSGFGKALSMGGKAIPILGGVISGAVDAGLTQVVGRRAIQIFCECEPPITDSTL